MRGYYGCYQDIHLNTMTQIAQARTDDAVSNTALDSQLHVVGAMTAFIDWLSFSFKLEGSRRLDKLIDTIRDLLGVEIYFDKVRVKDDYTGRYQNYSGSLGVTFSYTSFDNNDVCNARLTLPGQLLAARKPWHIKRVCRRLRDDWGARCTRIDLAVDDYANQLDFQVIRDATKNKEGVGFRGGEYRESYGKSTAGTTTYCGSRRSSKFARFYERGSVTNQKQICQRFEIEFKQDMATAVFADYLGCSSHDSNRLLSSIIRSAVSFNFKPDKNLVRSIVREWWQAFTERIVGDAWSYVRSQPRPSLDRTLRWIHRSVSKSLLLMREALGAEWMGKMLELWEFEARSRVTSLDNDRLTEFDRYGFSLSDLMHEY